MSGVGQVPVHARFPFLRRYDPDQVQRVRPAGRLSSRFTVREHPSDWCTMFVSTERDKPFAALVHAAGDY